jgi:hypothetical protein
VSKFEIILAGAIILSAIIQISLLIAIYRAAARFTKRANGLMESLEPQVRDAAESVRAVRGAVETAKTEVQATLAGVRATSEALGNLAQEEGREVARLVEKTTAMAERHLEETDQSLGRVRDRIAELSEGLDRSIFEPVRAVFALAVGVRKGIESLVTRRSGRTPESEELHSDEFHDVGPA